MAKENDASMEKEIEVKIEKKLEECCTPGHKHHHRNNTAASGGYFLGFLGAAIYYIGHAPTFWLGVVGFLKAIVWPVFLVMEIMKFLKM